MQCCIVFSREEPATVTYLLTTLKLCIISLSLPRLFYYLPVQKAHCGALISSNMIKSSLIVSEGHLRGNSISRGTLGK